VSVNPAGIAAVEVEAGVGLAAAAGADAATMLEAFCCKAPSVL
jgi:hypothetical protein